jgi:hypothetical protein
VQVNTQILLMSDEYASDLPGNATELASAILAAVGGDPETDICNVNIQDMGQVGTPPAPPPPPVAPAAAMTNAQGPPVAPPVPPTTEEADASALAPPAEEEEAS